MMAIVTVTQNTPASISACQIGANFDDFETVFPALAAAAYQCSILCLPPSSSGGAVIWQVSLQKSNYPAQVGGINDWMVFDGVNATIVPAAQFSTEYTQAA
jgi:hypothetical protein